MAYNPYEFYTSKKHEWQSNISAPRDGKLFLAWDGEKMVVINWPSGRGPGVYKYSNRFNKWIGKRFGDDGYFQLWHPLPEFPEEWL